MPPRDDIPAIPAPTGPGVVNGTAGMDRISVGYVDADGDRMEPGGSVINAGGGSDRIDGSDGGDTVWGGAGGDHFWGGDGDDIFIGGGDQDTFNMGDGDNLIFGDSPDGDLGGKSASDAPEPDFGNDILLLGTGNDTFFGGSGNDTIYAFGNIGHSVIVGGETGEIAGGDDDAADVLAGGFDHAMSLLYTGDEEGIVTQGDGSITFSEIEQVYLSHKDDTVEVQTSTSGTVFGQTGYDTLILPDPEPGEAAPEVVLYVDRLIPGSGGVHTKSGHVEFADGNRLFFIDFEEILCFATGTLIDTDHGPVPVETLTPGDRVLTRDHGYQPLIWTGRRDLSAAEVASCPAVAPICIAEGAMGAGLPQRDLIVSPRHRMLVQGLNADLLFGASEVLVAAEDLLGLPGVARLMGGVGYVHVMCDAHQILRAEGAWSESFQPSDVVLGALDADTRAELLGLFPDLAQPFYPSCRPVLSASEAGVLLAR